MSSGSRKRQRRDSKTSSSSHTSTSTSTSTSNTVGGPLDKLSKNDLICPVCFDVFESVQVTICGHSFCQKCIQKALLQNSTCPVCSTPLSVSQGYVANFSLNDVIAKVKSQESVGASATPKVKDIFKLTNSLDLSDLESLKGLIDAQVDKGYQGQDKIRQTLMIDFLSEVKRKKKQELERVQRELSLVINDEDLFLRDAPSLSEEEKSLYHKMKEQLSSHFTDLDQCYFHLADSDSMTSFPRHQLTVPSDSLPTTVPTLPPPPLSNNTSTTTSTSVITQSNTTQSSSSSASSESSQTPHSPTSSSSSNSLAHLDPFKETLMAVTKYSSFQELATLHYGDGPIGTSSIVSSIEFDKDGDFFAVGGVTKKVKIFDYHNVVSDRRPFATLHYPIRELPCLAKISSVAYSPYVKCQLATSDYDGTLSIWDSHYVTCTRTYQEHEKRVWSVSYNYYDSSLLATGGDDCSLKLWHLTMGQSLQCQPTPANVCSVRFQPNGKYLLAYGSADHVIRLVDIRNFSKPLLSCHGHKKAVSYVQFLNDKELVSASTDSELKLWSVDTGTCLRTYRGHNNDKNFVGLSVNNGYITCGSENNSFYMYHKHVSNPILSYKFHIPKSILPGAPEQKPDDSSDFVSAVCSRKDSTSVVAANSLGFIKVLKMV